MEYNILSSNYLYALLNKFILINVQFWVLLEDKKNFKHDALDMELVVCQWWNVIKLKNYCNRDKYIHIEEKQSF